MVGADSQVKILHVDDDADIREIALLALEAVGGMHVEQAASGKEALDKLGAFAPDVILLDYMMPEMSGEELYQLMQRDTGLSQVPCIFMTARVQPSEVEKLKALGARDVIEKPFDPMSLADQIKAILNS